MCRNRELSCQSGLPGGVQITSDLRGLDTLKLNNLINLPPCLPRETIFVTSRLLSCGSTLKEINSFRLGAKSFLFK